jgi:hypothetical protein
MKEALVLSLFLLTLPGAEAISAEVGRIHLRLPSDAGPVVQNIAGVFADQVARRCNAKVVAEQDAELVVELSIDPSIGNEGYRIADGTNGTVRIIGQGERGLLYGVGKFLRTSQFGRDGFTLSPWRGQSVPAVPVRGIYFATHFHNFYHDAPIDEVRRYVHELGLWGANLLFVWYDMHHFKAFDAAEAIEFRQRLHDICEAARDVGLGVGFGVLANEAYADSPAGLRAQKSGGERGGWYDCQVCPSKPGGLSYILAGLGQEFDWMADLRPEYVWIWPYDQGGCGCAECRPWGCNGFLKAANPLASFARQKLPGVKVVLSTWFLDPAEWQGLTKALNSRESRPDYILADSSPGDNPSHALDETTRAGVPLMNFPEISMWGRDPWGAYGANPTPARCEGLWKQTGNKLCGGTPYSEGIFEDMNKAIWLQFYWDKDATAKKTLREYIAFEFGQTASEDVMKAVQLFEETWCGKRIGPKSEAARELLQRAESHLTPQAKTAWRWRILLLRAIVDSELVRTKGEFRGPALKQACEELTRIYHAQRADAWVRPLAVPETKQ